jgi:hypothetical protein
MKAKDKKEILEEAKKTGKASVYDDARIVVSMLEIAETIYNKKDFEKIWGSDKVSDGQRLMFMQGWAKYFLKEKGKESDGGGEVVMNNYTNVVELADKLK